MTLGNNNAFRREKLNYSLIYLYNYILYLHKRKHVTSSDIIKNITPRPDLSRSTTVDRKTTMNTSS